VLHHLQKLLLVFAAMRRFADRLRAIGKQIMQHCLRSLINSGGSSVVLLSTVAARIGMSFLSEDSSWITGQVVSVDGGMSSVKLF